jgi:uncharacterized protein GlcG (DUF336 family)
MRSSAVRSGIVSFVLISACLAESGCSTTGVSARESDVLSDKDVTLILQQAETAASSEQSLVRVNPAGETQTTRMHIIVVNRSGRVVGRRSMPDAWHGSLSIATQKAFTAMAFSSDQNAMTSRTIGALSQPGGPLWGIGHSNQGFFQPGIIEIPGGLPLYKNGKLIGGLGVSGDGPDQDERVTIAGTRGFEAPEYLRIDRVTGGSVPYVK